MKSFGLLLVLYVATLLQPPLHPSLRPLPAPQAVPAPAPALPLRTGADNLLAPNSDFKKQLSLFPSVAVVANHTSLVGSTHLVDTLLSCGVGVVKIFCPEHGFRGQAEAGAKVSSSIDPATGLPIISLYGKNKKPQPKQLKDVDAVIFDLQDVGCRFYTYISTLHYVMEACAEQHIPCFVLDRPNPNNYVDGPVLEPQQKSFVGMHPVPVVYGLTIGEYAQMINGEGWLKDGIRCNLSVIAMTNYQRDSAYHLPVPPSPNLRNAHAIALYPSTCLFEGTAVSVGRGTPWPFEVFTIGSDTIDLRNYASQRAIDLQPLLQVYRHHCDNPNKPFFLKNNFFDRLAGTSALRRQIEQGLSEPEIRASWQPALTEYKKIREKYLLYR